jgi:hypothetical protein
VVFSLKNHSSTKHLRFKWPVNIPSLTFSPAVGHLHAGSTKDITVTFKSDVPVKLAPQEVLPSAVTLRSSQLHVHLHLEWQIYDSKVFPCNVVTDLLGLAPHVCRSSWALQRWHTSLLMAHLTGMTRARWPTTRGQTRAHL